MQKKLFLALFFLGSAILNMPAQTTIPLYADMIPNSKSVPNTEKTITDNGIQIVSNITVPTLTIFLPATGRANGTAIIICPGGGYWVNAISHEGTDVAMRFAALGITSFVLKYRIPNLLTMDSPETGPLQDAQAALLTVRSRAIEWNINPDRVGIMGFSAGGHLASTTGTHFTTNTLNRNGNRRPDFMMLIYPVISFHESVGHIGSRDQLIGKQPSMEKINLYSNELQVNAQTPPSFLVHASDDDVVKSENSILFYQASIKNNVASELHIYQKGGHGFGMNNKTTKDDWFERGANWLKSNGWL